MKALHTITWILIIVGALNWLVFALFNWEVGDLFGGMHAMVSKVIYILVGLSAIYEIVMHKGLCRRCNEKGMPSGNMPSGQPM